MVKAKKSDLPVLARILSEAHEKAGHPWSLAQAGKCLRNLFAKNPGLCFCIQEDGKIVGLVFCSPSFWETKKLKINEIAVAFSEQNNGLGSKALKELEKWATKKNFSSVLLTANQKNVAFGFYQKNGFTKTGFVMLEKKLSAK